MSLYIFEKSSPFSCFVFHYQSLSSLQQVLICLFSSCIIFILASCSSEAFLSSLHFCLSSRLIHSQRENFAAAYIVLLIPVISYSISSKNSSVPFHLFHLPALSIYYFPSVLVNFRFGTFVVALFESTLLEGLPLAYA